MTDRTVAELVPATWPQSARDHLAGVIWSLWWRNTPLQEINARVAAFIAGWQLRERIVERREL